eukprot:6084326-Pleurochrysis_carterae.AAC.1
MLVKRRRSRMRAGAVHLEPEELVRRRRQLVEHEAQKDKMADGAPPETDGAPRVHVRSATADTVSASKLRRAAGRQRYTRAVQARANAQLKATRAHSVRACVRACACACVRERACVSVRACVRERACVRA